MATQRRLRQRLSSRASIGDAGSSTGSNTLRIPPYKVRPIEIFGNRTDTFLSPTQGSQNLVGLANSLCILASVTFQGEVELTEEALMTYLSLTLSKSSEKIEDIPCEQVVKLGYLLGQIRTDFSLQPCLSGNCDFEPNTSSTLCCVLSLPLFHGWVLDPEVPIYDTIKGFNYDQLLEYRDNLGGSEHRAICDDLLNAAENQLTSYGFLGLSTELGILAAGGQSPVALLYWRGNLEVILLHEDDMFIFISDEGIVQQMLDAYYMLFEEGQQENIYFNRDFKPIPVQQFQNKANEWVENKKKAKKAKKNKQKKAKRKDAKEKPLSDEEALPGAADTSEEVKSSGDQPKDDQNAKNKYQSDELVTGLPPLQDQDLPVRQGSSDDTAADFVQEVKFLDEQSKGEQNAKNKFQSDEQVTGLPPQQDQELPAGQGSLDDAAADLVQEVKPLGQGLVAQQELKSLDEHQDDYEQGVPAASGNVVSPHADISVSHEDVQHKNDDDLLDDDPLFKFLTNFKERGSSGSYFKGMVAAFTTHRPLFYVPYEFIMAHDEKLALKIQDDISRISKDLDKVVVYYLKKNGVESPDDWKINIIGLPPPKWLAS